MERRIRLIRRVLHQAVLHRVEMRVIHVGRIIDAIADRVLPKPSLPNPALTLVLSNRRPTLSRWNRLREQFLQFPPSPREFIIVRWKRPNAVHMVRQYNPGVDMERRSPPNIPHGLPERIDVRHQKPAAPVKQVDREKVSPSGRPIATIIRHEPSIARRSKRRADKRSVIRRTLPPRPMADGARAYPPYISECPLATEAV